MPTGVYDHSHRKKNRICDIKGCNNKHRGKGLCKKHYHKQYEQDNKEDIAKQKKQYQKNNAKQISKRRKKYYEDNKEYIDKYLKQYYLNNREKILEYVKQYRKTPAGKAIEQSHSHNRRTLLKGLTLAIVQRVYEANIKKYGILTCYLCGKPIVEGDKQLRDSLDHSTPLTREGTNDYDNLGVAHLKCNVRKYTKTLKEWFEKNT